MTTPDFSQAEDIKAALELTREELAGARGRIRQLEGELAEASGEAEAERESSAELRAALLSAYHELAPYLLAERGALRGEALDGGAASTPAP